MRNIGKTINLFTKVIFPTIGLTILGGYLFKEKELNDFINSVIGNMKGE